MKFVGIMSATKLHWTCEGTEWKKRVRVQTVCGPLPTLPAISMCKIDL